MRERMRLLNMHGPNGTGRGRDKGRLIFPAFHFVPSLFYFGANCYRYPLRCRRWSPFLPLPRTRAKSSCNSKFSHHYLMSRTVLSKSRKKRLLCNNMLHFFRYLIIRYSKETICIKRRTFSLCNL